MPDVLAEKTAAKVGQKTQIWAANLPGSGRSGGGGSQFGPPVAISRSGGRHLSHNLPRIHRTLAMSAAAAKPVKAKKVAKPAAHPPYASMIAAAIKGLADKKGSSRQAILKYVVANNKVDAAKAGVRVKLALRKMVAAKKIVPAAAAGKKGAGAFKLPAKEPKAKKPKAKKAKKPKAAKKPAAKKVKKPKAAKKPAAKKAAKPKAAKKPAAKKPAKKAAKKAAPKKK